MKIVLDTKLYNQKEVAQMLGVTPNTVSLYTSQKRLSYTLIGGRKYYSEKSLKDFLLAPSEQ